LTSQEREDLMTRANAILSKEGLSQEELMAAILRATGRRNEEAQAGIDARSSVKGKMNNEGE
jgi:hypothetical protein